jgi:hypothetical protein
MTSLAGKTAGAASYDRTADSQEAIRDAVDAGGGSLTPQQVRDAMKLAPTGGSPAAGSVDEHLDTIESNLATHDANLTIHDSTVSGLIGTVQTTLDDPSDGLAAIKAAVDQIVAKLPSGAISDFSLGDTVDGIPVSTILELLMAMANGRYKLDTPTPGQITFYKRDNLSVLFVVTVTTTERTRV